MPIPNSALEAIAGEVIEDAEDLARAVCVVAAALLERTTPVDGDTPQQPETERKRMKGKPLGEKIPHLCSRGCGLEVVTFLSKNNKPYQCDIEIGYYKNQRQMLTAANWFHNCQKSG